MFSGDTGADSVLGLGEVDAFSISFSGPTTGGSSETISGVGSLLRFEFDTATDQLLLGPDVNRNVTGPLDIPFFYVKGLALSLGTYVFFGDGVGDIDDDGNGVTRLSVSHRVSVPEPEILALLGFGIAGAWRYAANSPDDWGTDSAPPSDSPFRSMPRRRTLLARST
jgi:hypothetical protein